LVGNPRESLEANISGFLPLPTINWNYVSGFDGEGSITIDTRPDSEVLVISLTFSQKFRPLLDAVAGFLRANGISCIVCRASKTVHEIRVRRIEDICRLLRRLALVLKRDQALAVLAYFDGRITGNQVLEIFDSEFRSGKRRSTPLEPGISYPLKHPDAVLKARKTRALAARLVNLTITREFLLQRIRLLPATFTTSDVARIFECSLANAHYRILRMQANGLVSCSIVGTRGHGKLVCTKL
jgi:hypothetical protein